MTTPDASIPPQPSRRDAWLTRHGVVGTVRRDALLAVVVALATLVLLPLASLLASEVGEPAIPLGTLALLTGLCAAQSLLLALVRTRPAACLLLVAAAQVAITAATPEQLGVRGAAPLVAAYGVATMLPGLRTVQLVAAASVVEVVGVLATAPLTGHLAAGLAAAGNGAALYAVSAAVGSWVATRRSYAESERRRAAEAATAATRSAVADERTRMARELHDIAAHHLSAMVVQAPATERLVERDPAAAREGLRAIRGQGRRTLDDLRLLVGILRDPGVAESGGPVPGLAALDELVAEARGLGDDVVLERSGPAGQGAEPGRLADVTAYRVVQEALSNARQHAPGAAVVVRLGGGRDRLVVEVVNGAASGPVAAVGTRAAGVGLVGMRERVQLAGGRLEVGPASTGGWRVRADLPVVTEEGSA